jgi:serine O-acetyltransferase
MTSTPPLRDDARMNPLRPLGTLIDMVAQVREYLAAHDGDWTKPGFQTLAVHRFGNWRMTVEPRLARAPLSLTYRAMEMFCRTTYGIELPYSATVGRRVVIEHQGGIVVHGNSVIGDECRLRQGVTIGARDVATRHRAPVLERGVDVGAGAKILGDITVGEQAQVGANAVVLQDVPAQSLAVGVPARVITKEEREQRQRRRTVKAVPSIG